MTLPRPSTLSWSRLQARRRLLRTGFFGLFLLAPSLDLLRFDLVQGHLVLLGQQFTLGLGPFLQAAATSPVAAALGLTVRLILPVLAVVVGVLWIARRWGRLYCGWLCPHFTVVEWLNGLMLKALGKPTLWEPSPAPVPRSIPWSLVTILVALGLAMVWAVSLITYILPPALIFSNLVHGTLTFPQGLFIGVATAVFWSDFLLARHLFCRFGCAVGMAQSLAWMSNPGALAATLRTAACAGCAAPCVAACPMRLEPRGGKRRIATCTQCGLCLQSCEGVRGHQAGGAPLVWVRGKAVAERKTSRFIHGFSPAE
ncbi:MAG: 4Fe-4S binding protein [Magnetococcales bacterium]|nr:4Fe-4S binding protein [Magnetococcales bacterium]